MKKPRILFVINNLNIGGVEKSLLGLLNALPRERYNIDLGVMELSGGFRNFVPESVNVFELHALRKNRDILRTRHGAFPETFRHNPLKSVKLMALYVMAKFADTMMPFYKGFIERDESMPEYDVAISYQGPSEILDYYVSHFVKAKRKIGWIHFDVSKFFVRPKSVVACYSKFERIFVVSEDAKKSFDKIFPEFSGRTEVMFNIIDREANLRLADAEGVFSPRHDFCEIVTVGRIAPIKGQVRAINAAAVLKSRGFRFIWHLVGAGEAFDEYRQLAVDKGVDDVVIFHGACTNPYPYMKNCDVYMQPSLNEGFCIAIGEAKLFGVPIVATDFVGAREQLHDVANAQIIPEPDPEVIADAVIKAARMGRVEPPKAGILPQVDRLVDIFG